MLIRIGKLIKHQNMKKRNKLLLVVIGCGLVCCSIFVFINSYIIHFSNSFTVSLENAPTVPVVTILGARIYPTSTLSMMLKDRVDTALQLYHLGKVEKILVSGDHGRKDYDEVNAIKNYLLEQHIPQEKIFLDHAGFDTYDSFYRARDIFGVTSTIVITQQFHLPRAIYLGNNLGIQTYGIPADKHTYPKAIYNALRESLARLKAFINITLHSQPKFLGEKIPITGDSLKSWD